LCRAKPLARFLAIYLITGFERFISTLAPQSKHSELKFQKGYDDLDYLEYAMLGIMSDRTVALISHKNTPMPGTDICVVPGQLDIVSILINTLDRLQLSERYLSWIHPDYEQ
jgi:hypothetical protein